MADHTIEMAFGAVAGALMGVVALFGLPHGADTTQAAELADPVPAAVRADVPPAPTPMPEAQTTTLAMEQRVEDLAERLDRVADTVESMK